MQKIKKNHKDAILSKKNDLIYEFRLLQIIIKL